MIVVPVMLKALDGKGDEVEREFQKFAPKVRNDPGTIAFVAHRNIDDPSKFFIYEKYESEQAHEYHFSATHFQEFAQAMASLQDGRPDFGRYREIV